MLNRRVIAHCRGGFEAEAAADLAAIAAAAGSALAPTLVSGQAFVVASGDTLSRARWNRSLAAAPPVFCRSIVIDAEHVALGDRDRLTPLIAAAQARGATFQSVWLETADSNDGRELTGLCKRFGPLLEAGLAEAGVIAPSATDRLHVLFTSRSEAWTGVSDATLGSPWPMGIPRLRIPGRAPSRSVAKLMEALLTFVGEREREVLSAGMRAVDLGAAPGGWTWLMAERGVRVTAVDNGALKGEIASDPHVTHVRVDGLTYRPRKPVDWMVCDIVEQPSRIAVLAADWIATGAARHAIFNLKLPMKRRYEEVVRCRHLITTRLADANVRAKLRLKQLYHDREEVTGYLARD